MKTSLAAVLALLQALPAASAEPVTLAPEAQALDSSRLFDGSVQAYPQFNLPLQSLDGGLELENGRLRRGYVTDPATGLDFELGDLGSGSDSPLLGSSPYFSLGKTWSGSGRYLDWGIKGRASVVDLNARWLDSVPAPDPLVPDSGDPVGLRSERLYFLGVLGHVGRAYPLWGPVDVGWSLMGVARMDHLFPHVSLDQTAGARVRLGGEHSVGLFGGVTESVALLTSDWAARSINRDDPIQPRMTASPHVEVGAWGPLAGRTSYQAWVGTQQNEFTKQTRLEGALSTPGLGGTVSAGLRAEKEDGPEIEFSREQRALRLALARRSGWEWSVETGKRDINYGGAGFNDNYVMFGLRVQDKPKGGSFGVAATRSSGELSTPQPAWAGLQGEVLKTVASLDQLLSLIPPAVSGLDQAQVAAALRTAYGALPPELQAAIVAELGGVPDFDVLAQQVIDQGPGALAAVARARDKLAALQAALSDPQRLERVVTRYLRMKLYESLESTSMRLYGRDVTLTPGLMLAMVHAYGQGQALIPPVTAATLTPALDSYLLGQLRERYGASCPGSDLVSCAMNSLPPELRDRLTGVPEQQAREIIASALGLAGETVRLEMNRFLLSAYLSAKKFDTLAVERGETPGVLNRRAVAESFARLDERRRDRTDEYIRSALELGARKLSAEVEELQRRQAADLAARAARLRGELAAAGIDAEERGLARLVADYGEENLRTFAAEARAKLASRGATAVALRYNPDPLIGLSIVREKGGRRVLTIPPASGREPGRLLDALVQLL